MYVNPGVMFSSHEIRLNTKLFSSGIFEYAIFKVEQNTSKNNIKISEIRKRIINFMKAMLLLISNCNNNNNCLLGS